MLANPVQALDEFDGLYAKPHFKLNFDDFTLELKARARLGFHDLQGQGGPLYDSPTDTATIGTRSPFVELDSFELSFRINYDEILWLNTNVDFRTDRAALSAIYFEYRQELSPWYSHAAELGYANPIAATHRHTARYPLIATSYWRMPEYHLAYGAKFQFSEASLSLHASLGFVRPLGIETIHTSPTYRGLFSTLSYTSAFAYSGNAPSGSALLRFDSHGFRAEAFANVGKIVLKNGIHTLIASFPNYRYQVDYDPHAVDALSYWYGGRLSYDGHGLHALAEVIASKEQLLDRVGYYAEVSYSYQREAAKWLNEIEFLMRYEGTHLLNSTSTKGGQLPMRTPDINNAISWNYKIMTLALRCNIFRDFLALRLEYALYFEKNDVPELNKRNLEIDNNELLLQIEARY